MTDSHALAEIIRRLDSLEERIWRAPDSLSTRMALIELELKQKSRPTFVSGKSLYTVVFIIASAIVAALGGYTATQPKAGASVVSE